MWRNPKQLDAASRVALRPGLPQIAVIERPARAVLSARTKTMNLLLRRASCFLFSFLLALAACSSSSDSSPVDGGATSDSGNAGDSGTHGDADTAQGSLCGPTIDPATCCKSFGAMPAGAGDTCAAGWSIPCVHGVPGTYPDHCCVPSNIAQCHADAGSDGAAISDASDGG
jgi:hypothetical protein